MSDKLMQHAVCLLLVREDGKILGIAKDKNKWALPGGKVDPNEDMVAAIVRETFEETGFVIASPQPFFSQVVYGDDGKNFFCITYTATIAAGVPGAPQGNDREGEARWIDPELLLAGPYTEYNSEVLKMVGLKTNGRTGQKCSDFNGFQYTHWCNACESGFIDVSEFPVCTCGEVLAIHKMNESVWLGKGQRKRKDL